MTDKEVIDIVKINSTYGRIVTESYGVLESLYKKFAVPVENYWFMPKYKAGIWDGKVHFVEKNGRFYNGLLNRIVKYLESDDREINVDEDYYKDVFDKEELKTEFLKFVDEELECEFAPYFYQLRGALKALYHKRAIIEHCTSSGKSFTIALVIMFLLKKYPNFKILIMVPKIDLVEQLVENFVEFGIPEDLIGKYYGFEKNDGCPITVSTWQSIHKKKQFLGEIDCLISDECLHPETPITMGDGSTKYIKDVNVGDIVLTINEETGAIENKNVLKQHHNLSINEQMFEIELENGDILKITGNHKVRLTNGIWKRVDELDGSEDLECNSSFFDINKCNTEVLHYEK